MNEKLFVVNSSHNIVPMRAALGDDWDIITSGVCISGRYSTIVVPLKCGDPNHQESHETWIHENLKCRLTDKYSRLIGI
jgi:hypothetical protein